MRYSPILICLGLSIACSSTSKNEGGGGTSGAGGSGGTGGATGGNSGSGGALVGGSAGMDSSAGAGGGVQDAGPDVSQDAAQDATTDACTDAACNPNACGSKALDCLGGACVQGVCQPVLVATSQNHPIAIRVDSDGTIFWANRGTTSDPAGGGDTGICLSTDGELVRFGPSDNAPFKIATSQRCPADLLLAGSYVYWLNKGTPSGFTDGQVMRATKTGGSITQLVAGLSRPVGFATDGTKLLVAQAGSGVLSRYTLSSGGLEAVVASGQTFGARGIAVVGGNVYWLHGPNPSTLRSLPIGADAGVGPDLVTNEIWAQSLIPSPSGDRLYWVNAQNVSGRGVRVYQIDAGKIDGFGSTYHPMTVTTNGSHAFWGHGALYRTELSTLDGGHLVSSGQSLRAVAVSGGAVYWANYTTGEIMKVAW